MGLNYIENEIFFTPEEMAKKLKLSAATVYKLLNNGGLPYFKVGKCYRIPAKAFEAYVMREGNIAQFIAPRITIPAAARSFVEIVNKAPKKLKQQILAIMLFGSHARGNANKESDIDILVIVSSCTAAIEKTIAEFSSRAMAHGNFEEFLSPIRMSHAHWKKLIAANSPLVDEIKKEGILLWSRESKLPADIETAQKRN